MGGTRGYHWETIFLFFNSNIGNYWTFGIKGLRVEEVGHLDSTIDEMINTKGPVIADIRVEKEENCFPMIPSGAAHNEMILGSEDKPKNTSNAGLALV